MRHYTLVVLCAGPGGPDAAGAGADDGGKKKKKKPKKKKEPPVPPEMAEAQTSAAGMLRRMTTVNEWGNMISQAGGPRLLLPLMNSKTSQTRWHAQAALWNLSSDVTNLPALEGSGAPKWLTDVIPPHKMAKENARPTTAPAAVK